MEIPLESYSYSWSGESSKGYILSEYSSTATMGRSTDTPHACTFCPKAFHASRDLQRHIRVHTGERPFQCDKCDRRFAREDNMRLHIRNVHFGERSWLTTQRKKKGLKAVSLVKHVPISTDGDAPQNQCPICAKFFFSARSLSMHKFTHSQVDRLPCTQCDRTFTHKGSLNLHMAAHARSNGENHNCQLCRQRFLKQENLERHMLSHTSNVVQEENVSVPMSENNPNDVQLVRNPTPVKIPSRKRFGSRLFECGTCEKRFFDQRKLAIHVIVQSHSSKLPYVCKQCGKSFTSLAGLKRHNTVTHKRENGDVYAERFKSKGKLRLIAKAHMGMNLMAHISRIVEVKSGAGGDVVEPLAGGNIKVKSRAARKSKTCRNIKAKPVEVAPAEDLKELISGILKANTGKNLKAHISGKVQKTSGQKVNGHHDVHGNLKASMDNNGNVKAQANKNLTPRAKVNLTAKVNLKAKLSVNLKSRFVANVKGQNGTLKSHFAGSLKAQTESGLKVLNGDNLKPNNLKPSAKTQSSPDDKLFKCKQCEKSFSSRGLLKRHVKIHSQEEKPLSPTKTLTVVSPVENEIKVVDAPKGEIQIECEHCGKHFSLQSYYDLHCKIMHRNVIKAV